VALTILLADDSVPAQNTGRKILSEAGYEVVTASNGLEALRKLNEASPALAILDIFMPGYTGLEICQKLRSVPATAALPVILTVGKLEPFREEDGTKVGANATLVKPFATEQMLTAVHALLGVPVPEVKAAPPLPPPAGEDEPIFAYTPTGQELLDKGYGADSSQAGVPQGGTENFLFNPDASHTPFSASSVELTSEEQPQTESRATPGSTEFVITPETAAAGVNPEDDSLLQKESGEALETSSSLDPLFETIKHATPPNILEKVNIEVGELPERLSYSEFTSEPSPEPTVPAAPKPKEEEHLSADELARRKAFEDLFNSDELPPVEDPLAGHSDESMELMPNLGGPSVGYEPHIEADPELEHVDPTRQPAVHLETTADPYLEKQTLEVEDILPQVASEAGHDVYLENNEDNKPFVSGAPLETLTSSGEPIESSLPEVAASAMVESPADEAHLDPLDVLPEKAAEAQTANVPEDSAMAHELLSRAAEAVEEHAGSSSLAEAVAGLAGGAGIAESASIMKHMDAALTHFESAEPETASAVPPADAAPELHSPLDADIHPLEAAPLAESAPPEVSEYYSDAAHAMEEARQPLATDGPLAAVFELAKHDFTHVSKPLESEAAAPEEVTEAAPLEQEVEVPLAESASPAAEHVSETHEAAVSEVAAEEEAEPLAAEPAADPLSAQEDEPSAVVEQATHPAAESVTTDHTADVAVKENHAGPSEVHSAEAERMQAAVEKVFDRFKPLLVAAIVRELARRD